MIQIYCGDGKGKTTASVGLSVRAAGNGHKVHFVQLMKGTPTGELEILSAIPGITVKRAPSSPKFSYQMTAEEREAERTASNDFIKNAFHDFDVSSADLLVVDECLAAVNADMIDEELVKELVSSFPKERELVLTGRTPEVWMLELADYVTDMEKIKHPFDKGVKARKGIEY